MTCYTFSCPAPCRRVIHVMAGNDEEAVWKLIRAGALKCRRAGAHAPCDIDHPPLPSLPVRQLIHIVRLSMTAEDLPEAATGHGRTQKTCCAMNP